MIPEERDSKIVPFEERLQKLDLILKKLEGGNLPLEEAIELYEQGVAMLRESYDILDKLEGRMVKLVRQKDGTVSEEPLNIGDDNGL